MSISSIERYHEWARRIEDDPKLAAEELKLAFADELARLLEVRGLKRTELAAKLKANRGYVTRVLNTEYNLTIETMARIAQALDSRISLHIHSRDSDVRWLETAHQARTDRVQRQRRRDVEAYHLPTKREVPVVADKPRRGKRQRAGA